MIMLLLIHLVGSAKAIPISLDGRQIAVSQASSSDGSSDDGSAIPLAAIIAISTILGVGLIVVAFVSVEHVAYN